MAILKQGKIYHYGEQIGTYEKTGGVYSAELGSYVFGGVVFHLYENQKELLHAIRRYLSECPY